MARSILMTVPVLLACYSQTAYGILVFSDDFESYTNVATIWEDSSSDRDPTTPPVGDSWTVAESSVDRVQVYRSPVSSTQATFDTVFGSQFLHQQRGSSGSSSAQANIPVVGQSTIANSGGLSLNIKLYNLVGADGFGGNLALIGFDDSSFSNRAFDLAFRPDGTIRNFDGTSEVLSVTYSTNSWVDITIDADFSTNTFDLTVDGTTVSDLGWDASGLTTIGLIDLEVFDQSGTSGRGGWDNLTVTAVPEPTAFLFCGLAGLAAGVGGLFTKLRRKQLSHF